MSDMDYLTEAERAALEDEKLDAGESEGDEAGQDDSGGDEAGDETAGEAGDDSGGEAGAADTGAEGEGEGGDGTAEAASEDSAPGTTSFSVPSSNLEEINGSIEKLRTLKDELEAAYESGESELTYAEHRAKLREIDTALLDLNAERAESQAIQKLNAAYQQEWWQREIRAFKREAAKDGVDYDADPKLESAWDKAVRFLGSDPDNAQQEAGWFLREAHEMVKARFKLGGKPEPAIPPAEKRLSKVDEALAARRAKAAAPPPGLSKLPQAGIEPEGKGEFSYLDDLSGMALERAVAKLSPEQQARWEAEQ